MVLDSVVVEVVQHGQAVLVALPVVRLGPVGTSGVGPQVGVGGPARGPPDGGVATVVDKATGPEVLLSLTCHQVCEVVLLGGVVKRDGSHALALTEGGSLAVGEGGAARPPGHQVALALEVVVSTGSSAAATAASLLPAAARPLENVPEAAEEALGRCRGNSQARKQKDSYKLHICASF